MGRFLGYVVRSIPTLVVLGVLVVVGVWGHRTGWKLPKFAELRGEVQAPDDWCKEHSVPEYACVECNESLMPKPKAKGWCKIHGVPECVLCNPELAHGMKRYQPTDTDLSRAKLALDFTPRQENNPICRTHQRRIQFMDSATVEKAGIVIQPVWTGPALEFVSAAGEIQYDQTRVTHMSTRSPGSITRVYKRLGDTVKAGDVLALIDAADVGKAKSELLQAVGLRQLKSQALASLKGSGVSSETRVRDADAALQEANIRVEAARLSLVNLGLPLNAADLQEKTLEELKPTLQFLGIPKELASGLDAKQTTGNLLPLMAPAEGIVTSRDVVVGEVVTTSTVLFELVDTRYLWLTLDLKAEDAAQVELGQVVRFLPDGSKQELTAKLNWISPSADAKTRTIKARADLFVPNARIKANTFGTGRIILREEAEVLVVPNEALQFEGCCQIVFVRDRDFLKPNSPKVFHVRKVRTGARDERQTEIIAGLLPGEIVVTKGSGLLLTELMRGNLGEGCACHSKK